MPPETTDARLIVAIIHQNDVLQCTTTEPFRPPMWELPSVTQVPAGSIDNAAAWLLSDWGFARTRLRRLGATSQVTNDGVVQSGTLVMAAVATPGDLRMRAPGVRGVRWRHLRDSPPGSPSAVDHVLAAIPLPLPGRPGTPAATDHLQPAPGTTR
ncbi:hypothetical protein [Amycolatopsis sp. lyj-112]|uniref:hypothetical protein n=1 Tax=Amycolatopsis sp. lyj-112 TaxID=2789288 RepID=UPI00397AF16C